MFYTKERSSRSLKVSSGGIIQAKTALLNCESKIALADELEISRTTVQKFFAGKPIGRENFHKICQRLKLSWQEIAELPAKNEFSQEKLDRNNSDINALVQEGRQKGYAHIQNMCGIVRVLDMSQPIGLNDIYTNVNILEKISAQQQLEITDLIEICIANEFERPNIGRIIQDRVPGIEAVKKYSKLFVLGKPGSGKTTFLKHIAIQCSSGKLHSHLVPIFIALKDFAENIQQLSLLEYIIENSNYGITSETVIKQLLSEGKMLVLLDGLDEVKEISSQQALNSVSSFFQQFHNNYFIITCRIAAQEHAFAEFTEIEIADFDDSEITNFTIKWFATKDPNKSKKIIQKLKVNSSIRELATNPLMLTLLCLVFEELADFPTNRAGLYKEGIDILLKKWDAKRNIERQQIYKRLSVQHKKDLLSQIALTTFERGDYFLKKQELEQHIANYICNLPCVSTTVSALQVDSAAVLKSIEQQHGLLVERARGIYSFSHLTFQEYFAAREIVANSNPQVLDTALKQLTSHITDKRWREVILLTVGMLRNADYMLLLMKHKVDNLLAEDVQLQAFLAWVNKKFHAVSVSYKPVMIRAFYFDLALARVLGLFGGTLDLARAIDCNFTRGLERSLALDLALDRALALDQVIARTHEPSRVFKCVLERVITLAYDFEPQFSDLLEELKEQLPEFGRDQKTFMQWWKINGSAWTEELRRLVIAERNIGHNWQFSKQQREVLFQYYQANQLLIDCLNSNYYVTRIVRAKIENSLLLPLADIS